MIILPLQWDRGTTNSIGDRKLVFSADKSIDLGEFNPFKIEQGTQFLVMMIPVGTEEAEEFANETKEQTLQRFKRHMEALIGDLARMNKKDPSEFREQIKATLIEKGIIQKSTSELDLGGYAQIINMLRSQKFELMKNL